MDIDAIRKQLRDGNSKSLNRKRKIALLSVIGLVDFGIISLYQLGVIRHLPDFPGKIFDSDKVNASHKAYATGVPDGTISATLYGINLVLASAGGTSKSNRHPILDVLLGGVVIGSALGGLNYLLNMVKEQERACPYCITGATINFAMVPYVIPVVKKGIQQLKKRGRIKN